MARAKPRRDETPARLHQNQWGVWHWKPEKKLRGQFKGASLGKDRDAAIAEARRLNAEVEAFADNARKGLPPLMRRRKGPLTVSQLANLWRYGEDGLGSDNWRGKRASTQKLFGHLLRRLEAEFGDEVAGGVSRKRVQDWLEPIKRRTPGTARGLAIVGRILFGWAIDKEHIATRENPFARPGLSASGKRERLFTLEDVLHFVAVCDGTVAPADDGRRRAFIPRPSLGTMLILAFGLVQREWDVLALTRDALREEVRDGKPTGATRITIHQSKSMKVGRNYQLEGGKKIDVRLPPIVARRLTAAPAPDTKAAARHLCVNEYTGRPYAAPSLAVVVKPMIARCIAVDPKRWGHMKGLTMRDGRRSGFVHLRGLGFTVEQICNLSGHSLEDGYAIVEHYLPRTADEADKVAAMMTGEL